MEYEIVDGELRTSDAGKEVATGTYFYRLSVEGVTETRKLMLLK